MAPEQAVDARRVDIRADIYSLGCTLYCLLAGRPPFGDDRHPNLFRKLVAHREEPAPTLVSLRPDLPTPPALPRLVDRLLAKDPADRPSEPRIVADALAEPREATICHAFSAGRPSSHGGYAERYPHPVAQGEGPEVPGIVPSSSRGGQPDVERSPRSAPAKLPRRQGPQRVVRHDYRPALDCARGPRHPQVDVPAGARSSEGIQIADRPDRPSTPTSSPHDPDEPQPVKALIRLLPGRKLDQFTKFIRTPQWQAGLPSRRPRRHLHFRPAWPASHLGQASRQHPARLPICPTRITPDRRVSLWPEGLQRHDQADSARQAKWRPAPSGRPPWRPLCGQGLSRDGLPERRRELILRELSDSSLCLHQSRQSSRTPTPRPRSR